MSVLAIVVFGVSTVALAAEPGQPVTRQQVLDIAEELVTPGGCPSLTLAECTLPTAFKIREEIAQMLAQGMTKDEIIDALVAKYGKAILGAPERKGWGLVVWYMPYAVMGMAAFALGGWLYRRRRTTAMATVPDTRKSTEAEGSDTNRGHDETDIEKVLKKYL